MYVRKSKQVSQKSHRHHTEAIFLMRWHSNVGKYLVVICQENLVDDIMSDATTYGSGGSHSAVFAESLFSLSLRWNRCNDMPRPGPLISDRSSELPRHTYKKSPASL